MYFVHIWFNDKFLKIILILQQFKKKRIYIYNIYFEKLYCRIKVIIIINYNNKYNNLKKFITLSYIYIYKIDSKRYIWNIKYATCASSFAMKKDNVARR